jgi:hypothetical protein
VTQPGSSLPRPPSQTEVMLALDHRAVLALLK